MLSDNGHGRGCDRNLESFMRGPSTRTHYCLSGNSASPGSAASRMTGPCLSLVLNGALNAGEESSRQLQRAWRNPPPSLPVAAQPTRPAGTSLLREALHLSL